MYECGLIKNSKYVCIYVFVYICVWNMAFALIVSSTFFIRSTTVDIWNDANSNCNCLHTRIMFICLYIHVHIYIYKCLCQ